MGGSGIWKAVPEPLSEDELMERALAISGLTLGELSDEASAVIPSSMKGAKGYAGKLLELYLGATGSSRPVCDFEKIHVELKSIPIGPDLRPLESTYVCMAHLTGTAGLTWEKSSVRNKLSRVLFFPVEGDRAIPLGERRLGTPFFWSPDAGEEEILKADWEEHLEKISEGRILEITAHDGTALQIRPKAADSTVMIRAVGRDGEIVMTGPRGFYLRRSFTEKILKKAFMI